MDKPGGYAKVPRWLLRAPWSRAYEIAVYAILVDYADDAGYAWPSLTRLAALTGTSDSTVQRTLRRLERGGAITREIARGQITRYRVMARPFGAVPTVATGLDQVAAVVTGGRPAGTRGPSNPGHSDRTPPPNPGHSDRALSTTPVTNDPQPRSERPAIRRTNEEEGGDDVERVRRVIAAAAAAVNPVFADQLAARRAKGSPPATDATPTVGRNAREAAAGGEHA